MLTGCYTLNTTQIFRWGIFWLTDSCHLWLSLLQTQIIHWCYIIMFPFDTSCLQLRRWRGTWLSWPVKWLRVTSAACTASGGRWASLYLQNHPSPSLTSPLVNTSLSIVFVCLFIYLSAIWALKSKLNIINSEFQSELGTSNFMPF